MEIAQWVTIVVNAQFVVAVQGIYKTHHQIVALFQLLALMVII